MDQGLKHCAIFISKNSLTLDQILNHKEFVSILKVSSSKTAVFSTKTNNEIIKLESKRDTSPIMEREGQSFRSMSSGEQKRALLNYLVDQDIDFLIVENVFDNLDPSWEKSIKIHLETLSKKCTIIQVMNRETPILSILKNGFYVEENGSIQYFNSAQFPKFKNRIKHRTHTFKGNIPRLNNEFQLDYNTFVSLKDVSVSYHQKPILYNITWNIRQGEFWQLKGANGIGKTTLLSLITGDNNKAYGQDIILFDRLRGSGETIWDIKKKIGYFTPTINELFDRRHTVIQMLVSGFYDSIGLYVKALNEHIALAKEWLALLEMSSLQNKTFCTLPLSQQKIILVARAMVKLPPLLILDEPTTGIDDESVGLFIAFVNKIAKESNSTIIYVSHRKEEGIDPEHVFQLESSPKGAVGKTIS